MKNNYNKKQKKYNSWHEAREWIRGIIYGTFDMISQRAYHAIIDKFQSNGGKISEQEIIDVAKQHGTKKNGKTPQKTNQNPIPKTPNLDHYDNTRDRYSSRDLSKNQGGFGKWNNDYNEDNW